MKQLATDPGFCGGPEGGAPQWAGQSAGDAFYAMLIAAHRDLDDAQSELLNARLVLLLANHIGELAVLQDALQRARHGVDAAAAPT